MPREEIYYSDKYNDDFYEYRHVIVPKKLAKYVALNWWHLQISTPQHDTEDAHNDGGGVARAGSAAKSWLGRIDFLFSSTRYSDQCLSRFTTCFMALSHTSCCSGEQMIVAFNLKVCVLMIYWCRRPLPKKWSRNYFNELCAHNIYYFSTSPGQCCSQDLQIHKHAAVITWYSILVSSSCHQVVYADDYFLWLRDKCCIPELNIRRWFLKTMMALTLCPVLLTG